MSFIEFVCNRNMYFTTNYSLFEIIYGFSYLKLLNLIPSLVDERINLDSNKKRHHKKKKKKKEQYTFKANKKHKVVRFESGN